MSQSTQIWEGITASLRHAGDNYINAHPGGDPVTDNYVTETVTETDSGYSFIGAFLHVPGHSAPYQIQATTGSINFSDQVKLFYITPNLEFAVPEPTVITVTTLAEPATSSESSSSTTENTSENTSESYTPDAPDVTEEYSISHGESTVKYSPLGGDVGITQKAVDEINAKEASTAETAIQNSYAEDAADAKLLNHARLRNQGQI